MSRHCPLIVPLINFYSPDCTFNSQTKGRGVPLDTLDRNHMKFELEVERASGASSKYSYMKRTHVKYIIEGVKSNHIKYVK